MSDAPKRIWIAEDEICDPWWTIERNDDMDEYVRADLVEAAVRRALEAAIRATAIMPEGGLHHHPRMAFQSALEGVEAHIRALAADPEAVRKIVEGEDFPCAPRQSV